MDEEKITDSTPGDFEKAFRIVEDFALNPAAKNLLETRIVRLIVSERQKAEKEARRLDGEEVKALKAEVSEWKRVAMEQARLHDEDSFKLEAEIAEARKERSDANVNWNNTITELQAERERSKALAAAINGRCPHLCPRGCPYDLKMQAVIAAYKAGK